MAVKLWAYKQGSRSARAIATGLGIKIIKHEGSRYRPRQRDVIINWGSSGLGARFELPRVINDDVNVAISSNKLESFRALKDVCLLPAFTEDKAQAIQWVNEGKTILCRTILNGHSGQGIVIAEKELDIVDAPLYTIYIKKDSEYRIHMMKASDGSYRLIDSQRKIRDPEREPEEWRIRSHQNGFIYIRNNVVLPDGVADQALKAVEALGLDFGAVDIIYNKKQNKCYVLEVNCAPGLSGQTIDSYVNGFKELLQL